MGKEMEQMHHGEEIYKFLVEYMTENGYAPSIREICAGTHLSSTSSVLDYLRSLRLLGMIEIKEGASRAIKLVGYKLMKVG